MPTRAGGVVRALRRCRGLAKAWHPDRNHGWLALPRLAVVLRHLLLHCVELLGDRRASGEVPEVGLFLSQRQRRGGPGLTPPGLEAPGAPADVGGAGAVVPGAVVEGAEPGAAQVGAVG